MKIYPVKLPSCIIVYNLFSAVFLLEIDSEAGYMAFHAQIFGWRAY